MTPIRADILEGTRHGFFSREGGVSTGLYGSLNCGPGSSDDPAAVAENRGRVAAKLEAETLLSTGQCHSADVIRVTHPWTENRPDGDAMVTDRTGIALGVLTADCAPVLFADRTAGVIGAAHAGWKGALSGILEATLEAMTDLGAGLTQVVAAVGPTISQRAYEVGPEFVDRFLEDDPETARFFAGGKGDRAMFDLPGYCLARLRAAGVGEAAWTGHCTYSDERRFFSYRRTCHRAETDYGRLVAAITL